MQEKVHTQFPEQIHNDELAELFNDVAVDKSAFVLFQSNRIHAQHSSRVRNGGCILLELIIL
jgi:hypothetical protein